MKFREKINKKDLFKYPRYWYYISTTLTAKKCRLTPINTEHCFYCNPSEFDVKRISVGPTIAHCLTAIHYYSKSKYNIYRTVRKVKAVRPYKVRDARVTLEGWLVKPVSFVKVGRLSIPHVRKKMGRVIRESASDNNLRRSAKVLKWWKDKDLNQFIKSVRFKDALKVTA